MSPHRTSNAHSETANLLGFVDTGIEHCRAGRWEKGVDYLGYVAERNGAGLNQPGLFFSFLGCGIARTQDRKQEGRTLCERAVEIEFYQPENWANLADVLLLCNRRAEAIDAIIQGLKIDPQQPRLQQLHEEMGLRRRPVLPFLGRSNPINRLLGVMWSQMTRSPPKRTADAAGES